MREELRQLSDDVLMAAAVELRRVWLGDPENGTVFLGLLAVGEELYQRNLKLTEYGDELCFNKAAQSLLEKIISIETD